MSQVALRSPSEKVGGLFYFGRVLDKIRVHAKGDLPSDYHANLGKGFDEKCVRFLRVSYDQLVERVKKGGTDEEILQWCFSVGRKPSEDDLYVWNEFMRKRGWNDEVSDILKRRKAEAGMSDRAKIDRQNSSPITGHQLLLLFLQRIDSLGQTKIKLGQAAFAMR